ncbi:hypothetical protein [Capnocytophaga canis]|uniref:hypothetical protein n=1 Tax=Capnocytophaga canis TaxID=1848903 RepID=UPI001562801E|nr:hypothetical protein [Capnocytophaga canis]
MRIYGRITIYGEYLMHGTISGLIIPSNLFLDTVNCGNINSLYSKKKDNILPIIEKMGIKPCHTLYGNLPLGYGMAGSTALSLLHLSNIKDLELKKRIVHEIDKEIHGFIPSGIDFESCIRQEYGLYSTASGWQTIDPLPISYSLFKFPKEKKMSLNEVKKKILSEKDLLIPIQNELNSIIRTKGTINFSLLKKYSKILLSIGVYSNKASVFISTLLRQGIIAKGIGGVYDKIVLVIHPEENTNHHELQRLVSELSGEIISTVHSTHIGNL